MPGKKSDTEAAFERLAAALSKDKRVDPPETAKAKAGSAPARERPGAAVAPAARDRHGSTVPARSRPHGGSLDISTQARTSSAES